MVLYDYEGNEHEFDLSDKIGNGFCGEVYRYDSEFVLKKYRESCPNCLKLKRNIYEAIKEINSPHVVEIINLLYTNKIGNSNSPLFGLRNKSISGYMCKYIKPDKIDILSIPTEYLLYNINELNKVFTEFSNRNIRAIDVKVENVVMQNDKIVLIDLDLFRKGMLRDKRIERLNQIDLLHLFRDMVSDSIFDCEYNIDFLESIEKIFDLSKFTKETDLILEITKQFQKYKYPVDYIYEYTKNRL